MVRPESDPVHYQTRPGVTGVFQPDLIIRDLHSAFGMKERGADRLFFLLGFAPFLDKTFVVADGAGFVPHSPGIH